MEKEKDKKIQYIIIKIKGNIKIDSKPHLLNYDAIKMK